MVYVGVDGRGVVGRLGFRDVLRPDSAEVVRRLQDMSIRVALLSGDNAAAVGAIADAGWHTGIVLLACRLMACLVCVQLHCACPSKPATAAALLYIN